jgi:hypothetical protein
VKPAPIVTRVNIANFIGDDEPAREEPDDSNEGDEEGEATEYGDEDGEGGEDPGENFQYAMIGKPPLPAKHAKSILSAPASPVKEPRYFQNPQSQHPIHRVSDQDFGLLHRLNSANNQPNPTGFSAQKMFNNLNIGDDVVMNSAEKPE